MGQHPLSHLLVDIRSTATRVRNWELLNWVLLGRPSHLDDRNLRGRTPLCLAAGNGRNAEVKSLLAQPYIDVNARDDDGQTALSSASSQVNLNAARALLANDGQNKKAKDVKGRTALSRAAESGSSAILRLMLHKGDIDKNHVDSYGLTALSWAAESGHAETVQMLLSEGGCDPNPPGYRGPSLLLWSVKYQHEKIAELLLEHPRADTNCRDQAGRTPLFFAASSGFEGLARKLLDKGADPNVADKAHSWTPLSQAAEKGYPGLTRLLVRTKGVDPDPKDFQNRTPLSLAAANGNLEIVEVLLERGSVDLNATNSQGETPVSRAASGAHYEVVEALLSRDECMPHLQGPRGQLLTSWAVKHRRGLIVRLLLGRTQIDPDFPDQFGRTPLSFAAAQGDTEMAALFLEKGSDVTRRDKTGRAPLSWAALGGHAPMVQLLLEQKGVDPEEKDVTGRTPLSWAAAKGSKEATALLLSTGGVDPDSKDNNGLTPLWWAAGNTELRTVEQQETIALLLSDERIDPDSRTADGQTMLSKAARSNDAWLVKQLLQTKRVDVNWKDGLGRAPLSLAVSWKGGETKYSQAHGADNDEMASLTAALEHDKTKSSEPHASESGCHDEHDPLTTCLEGDRTKNGEPTDTFDYEPPLPPPPRDTLQLWTTARVQKGPSPQLEIVLNLLREDGIDVNTEDHQGRTPLLLAAKHRRIRLVETLLATEGIDVHAQDHQGRTALHWTDHSRIMDPAEMEGPFGNEAEDEPLITRPVSSQVMWVLIYQVAEEVLQAVDMDTEIAPSVAQKELEPEVVLDKFKELLSQYCDALQRASTLPEHALMVPLVTSSKTYIQRMAGASLGAGYSGPAFPSPPSRSRRERAVRSFLQSLEYPFMDRFPDTLSGGVSLLRAFLVEGDPIVEFRTGLRKFLSKAVWEKEMLEVSRSFPATLPDLIDVLFHGLESWFPEPAVPAGMRRVRWTCACGMRLYDDYLDDGDAGGLDELEAYLNSLSANAGPVRSAASELWLQVIGAAFKWVAGVKRRVWGPKVPALPVHSALTVPPVSDSSCTELSSSDALYLLHCHPIGKYGLKLRESLIPAGLDDQSFFQFLRSLLRHKPSERGWFTLRNVTKTALYKFSVDFGHFASLQYCGCAQNRDVECICVPPPALIGQEYQCHPCPPKDRPPLSWGKLAHYMLNPSHVPRGGDWIFSQVPKKMREPLRVDPHETTPGWGLYLEEGWNWLTIYILMGVATVGAGFAFVVCWYVFKMDIQGATGIGSFWFAACAVPLALLVVKCNN